MPPLSPLIYANAIIPDPRMARIITAIADTRAASSAPIAPATSPQIVVIDDNSEEDVSRPPLAPAPSSSRIVVIDDSSEEDVSPPPLAPAPSSSRIIEIEDSSEDDIPDNPPAVQTLSQEQPMNVVCIDDDSSEDEDAKDFRPKSTTHYHEFTPKDYKANRKETSRLRNRAVAKDEHYQQARQVSYASSYADDGTLDLIANLCIDENDNILPEEQPEAPSSSTPKQQYPVYVVFAGLLPGIYDDWLEVKGMVNKVSHNIYKGYKTRLQAEHMWVLAKYKGYKTRLQAERMWVLANALGSTRVLDGEGRAVAVPSGPMPPLVVNALGELSDGYLDADWYVVTKGRTPGVYPAWNFAATQSQGVGGAIHKKYGTRAKAQRAFDLAHAAGL
ncbi:hypothetical protein FIBSPDRAFT_906010, partial [Athelia psychrophila]